MSGKSDLWRLSYRWAAAVSLSLCACTVGPKYKEAPAVAHNDRFVRAGEEFASTVRPAAKWWLSLGDAELARLIERALSESPEIDAASARLRKARMVVREEQASELPKLSADATALRSNARLSASSSGFQFYHVGFDASWELDLYGKARSALRAASAEADGARAELENLHVSLAAEVGRAYVGLRAQQQELALLQRSAEMEQEIFHLTEQRRGRGVASDMDVERMLTQLESTKAMVIPVQQSMQESLDRLAVLTGRAPGSLDAELAQAQPLPELPANVEISDPADMLRRRPDIRAAERQIAARTATLDLRTADLFPSVNLLGGIGYGASSLSGLIHHANFSYFAVPSLRWSFLDFGANRARVRQSAADRDEAIARYRSAVLAALQDAEASLSRFGNQRRTVMSLESVKSSADRAAEFARQRWRAGTLSEIDLLDTERTRLSAEQNLLQSREALAENFISLQKSLGLGWE